MGLHDDEGADAYTHVYVDVYINAYMHMCSMYECWSADANLSARLQVHVYSGLVQV